MEQRDRWNTQNKLIDDDNNCCVLLEIWWTGRTVESFHFFFFFHFFVAARRSRFVHTHWIDPAERWQLSSAHQSFHPAQFLLPALTHTHTQTYRWIIWDVGLDTTQHTHSHIASVSSGKPKMLDREGLWCYEVLVRVYSMHITVREKERDHRERTSCEIKLWTL
jgi:hypothetical protein